MLKKLFLMLIPVLFVAGVVSADQEPAHSVLYSNYFDIGTALAADSIENARAASKLLERAAAEAISQAPDNKSMLTVKEQAGVIAGAKDLKSAREAYAKMSDAMIAFAKPSEMKADQYYCPMAKKSWLQQEAKVRNPYLGKEMSGCGEKKSR